MEGQGRAARGRAGHEGRVEDMIVNHLLQCVIICYLSAYLGAYEHVGGAPAGQPEDLTKEHIMIQGTLDLI